MTATRLGRRDAEDAEGAGFDLRLELAVAGDADGDLVAEHGRERFAAAREGDVVDGLGVDADGLGEEARRDVVGAAGGAAGPGDGARIGLQLGRRGRPASAVSDAAGTTITSYSPVRRAIGVTASSVTGDLLVRMAPTMT